MGVESVLAAAMEMYRAGRLPEAAGLMKQAIAINPNAAEYWVNLGTILDPMGRLDEAIFCYRKAIALQPNLSAPYNNLGNALAMSGRMDEAIGVLNTALSLRPDDPDALFNLGNVFDLAGDRARAVEFLRRAIAVRPDWTPAHNNLGLTLCAMGKVEEGIAAYRRALELSPSEAGIHQNLGSAYRGVGEVDPAIECFESALKLQPRSPWILNDLGNAWKDRGQAARAFEFYGRAIEVDPGNVVAGSNRIYASTMHPGFDGPVIRRELELWHQRMVEPLKLPAVSHGNAREAEKKLRVGFVSADFRDHVVGRNILPLMRERDREGFEFFCYSGVGNPDGMTARFRSLADGWRDIGRMSDDTAAEIIRRDQIDILVDLSVHTRGNRLLVFARKPAPVQVTFAGYPGSTGLAAMDWRLTDVYLDPPEGGSDGDYSEKSFRLANSFWCYDAEAMTWDESGEATSLEVGSLPAVRNGFVTFGCQNNFCKVNEGVLELWGKVLRAVENSRMVLMAPVGEARKRATGGMGVDESRVDFVTYQPRRKYLAEFHRIDLGLDTFPYNGHTASLDAMWMGVPVITRVGKTVAGRAGWSQLSNLKLTELAAHSDEEFVTIAVEWAGNAERLQNLRHTLRQRILASPLGDGKKFASDIMDAFRAMWRQWCQR